MLENLHLTSSYQKHDQKKILEQKRRTRRLVHENLEGRSLLASDLVPQAIDSYRAQVSSERTDSFGLAQNPGVAEEIASTGILGSSRQLQWHLLGKSRHLFLLRAYPIYLKPILTPGSNT